MTAEEIFAEMLAAHWPGRRVVVVMTAEFPPLLEVGYLVVTKLDGPKQLLCLASAVPALHNWFSDNPGDVDIDPDCIRPILARRKALT